MDYDELTPEQQEIWDAAYEEGWDAGFASETGYDQEAYNDGFKEGAKAEQARIQYVLNMMFESSLNMGHGNKAVQYRHAMDLLRPIQIDYSPEAYQRGLEADGF
jgi:hypothetical protein